jgi:hypothetical protein
MLVEWSVKERSVKFLTVILGEVDEEDDQKIDGGTVYKQVLINAELRTGKIGQKNRADWEKSIKGVRVSIGL